MLLYTPNLIENITGTEGNISPRNHSDTFIYFNYEMIFILVEHSLININNKGNQNNILTFEHVYVNHNKKILIFFSKLKHDPK